MKKIIFLLMIAVCTTINASSFMKNGEMKLVDDKDYTIRCINGYKWIQFVEPIHGKGGTYYVPSGNPQQMFERDDWDNVEVTMLPVKCDK